MMKYTLLIYCIFFIIACDYYEPQGTNEIYVEEKTEFNLPNIKLNCFDDTVNITEECVLKFSVISNGNPIEQVHIESSSHKLNETFDRTYGELELNSTYINEGNHELTARVIFKSNTGSLADELDAELYYVDYLFVMNYAVMYKQAGRRKSKCIKAIQEDDKVRITWRKYNLDDFDYYKLYHGRPNRRRDVVWSQAYNDYNYTETVANMPIEYESHTYSLRIYKKDGSYIQDQCNITYTK